MKYDIFKNKKILITGHTGFKGSWLLKWLSLYSKNLYGISNNIPTKPSLFEDLQLKKLLKKNFKVNVTDNKKISNIINSVKFDFIFHLAAQPLLIKSYNEPLETIYTNIMGTSNILDSLKKYKHKCAVVIITSDKCYENNDDNIAFKENDRLGGKDIYGASKACAEIVFNSYFNSFFKNSTVKLATVRAGNVIGGGDWSDNRIVPDFFKSAIKNNHITIRNPKSTRPWQHVLEPLNGYLKVAKMLYKKEINSGESFNFGPNINNHVDVITLINDLAFRLKKNTDINAKIKIKKNLLFENNFLRLNIHKSKKVLGWKPILTYIEMINFTSDCYTNYQNSKNVNRIIDEQIKYFETYETKKNI
tara:strand:+ start:145 stop:1227 length:1083 start_codon:yes stop_codon:yes gene_type:complete